MNAQLNPPVAVVFDIGDTVLEECGFDLPAGIRAVVGDDAAVQSLANAFRAQVINDHQHDGEPLLAAWLRDRVPSLASMSVEAIEDMIWPAAVSLLPRPGVESVIDQLSNDGVAMAAVSNAGFSGRALHAELSRHGLGDRMRFVLSSADVGSRKPATTIFRTAVDRLGAPASQTWFVGDTFEEDVIGADRAGLQPIWFSARASIVPPDFYVPIVSSWSEFAGLYHDVRARAGG